MPGSCCLGETIYKLVWQLIVVYIYIYIYIQAANTGAFSQTRASMAGSASHGLFYWSLVSNQKECPVQNSQWDLKWMPWGSAGVHNELKKVQFREHFRHMASQ